MFRPARDATSRRYNRHFRCNLYQRSDMQGEHCSNQLKVANGLVGWSKRTSTRPPSLEATQLSRYLIRFCRPLSDRLDDIVLHLMRAVLAGIAGHTSSRRHVKTSIIIAIYRAIYC